ncbi:unknown protein [Seminavis robusta]|uniref:Uncharacterized protein n=1 Tax=Seminavis robusta TaxID=568900 RepID=A0A9N8EZB2_9STRA|nr:unknown protein [Seminavis robusta]|eukprot:Sro2646_g333560.1 n/a (219) ;mRNA; r:3099-3755
MATQLAADSAKTLILMPVPVLRSDYVAHGEDPTNNLESIKGSHGETKFNYRAPYCGGQLGPREIIPQAIHCVDVIDNLPNLNNIGKVVAFKASLYGTALENAELALTKARTALENTDNNVAQNPENTIRYGNFRSYMQLYGAQFGSPDDALNQKDGVKLLKKPTKCPVDQWHTILFKKNKALAYCQGHINWDKEATVQIPLYTIQEMISIFLGSFPLE